MKNKTLLPASVRRQLDAVRGMLRLYVLVQTCLLIACWLLLVFWFGSMIDYLPVRVGSNETPKWLRLCLLLAMAIGSLWILVRWTLPRLWTPIHDRSLALLIERQHPELNNELVTAVELDHEKEDDFSNPVAHEAMLERVRSSVSDSIKPIVPSELFNWQPIWASGIAVVFGALVTLITAIGMNDWLSLWSQRLFTLSDQPWPRAAELRSDGIQLQFPMFTGQLAAERVMLPFEDGVVRVPMGATALLQISANADAKKVPEVCTMFYSSADGARGRANLRRVGSPREGWQQFTLDGPPLDGISHDISLDVVGLDARLRDLQLEVVESAVVSGMQLDCQYPKYLLDSLSSRPAREVLEYRAGMRIPEGTAVSLLGQSSSVLSKVEYMVRGSNDAQSGPDGTDGPSANATPTIRSVEPNGKEFAIDLAELRSSQVIEIRLIDEFGLSSDQILRYVVTVLEDMPPEVESKLAGIGIAVTPNAKLPIRGSVTDDNGVAEVVAELVFNESEPIRLPLERSEDGQLESDIDLEKLAEQGVAVTPGMTVGLMVSARDYFDLDDAQHVGSGQPQQLAVVTADQLLVILDRQELELRQRLDLIISELQQVNEALEQLGGSLEAAAEAALNKRPASWQWVSTQDAPRDEMAEARAQQRRMAVLRAQQSLLQSDKSEQELAGVASRIDNIRLQLLNNRIDSYDRQNRLQTKVHQPLVELLDGDFQLLSRSLAELQTATMSGQGFEQTQKSLAALAKVLDSLEAIKSNMLDIESFNEIIDLVRSLLEDQETILDETEKQQKARILELLRGDL